MTSMTATIDPKSFERYRNPVAEVIRAQLRETEEQALDAAICFFAMKGSVTERSAACTDKDAAAMIVDVLRTALASYIVAGVDPMAKLQPRSNGPRPRALQSAVDRWRDKTAKALEQRLTNSGVW